MITTPQEARNLVDVGAIASYKDVKNLLKLFSYKQEEDFIRYCAERFTERYHNRDAAEIILESLLLWLTLSAKEGLAVTFLQTIFEHPERMDLIEAFPHLCLNLELVERRNQKDIFDISMFLVAQMGIQVDHLAKQYPQEFTGHDKTLSRINAIMISMSNISTFRAQLILFNYFSVMELKHGKEHNFRKIIQRFGTSFINRVFSDLSRRKTQSLALAYLLDNLPYMILASDYTQLTLHEILRFNMLKFPVRFALFLEIFTADLIEKMPSYTQKQQKTLTEHYLKHLALLLKVIAGIDQPRLSKELLLSLCDFQVSEQGKYFLQQLTKSAEIRKYYRDLLSKLMASEDHREYIESFKRFRSRTAGRKPFLIQREVGIFDQIYQLGKPRPRRRRTQPKEKAAAA